MVGDHWLELQDLLATVAPLIERGRYEEAAAAVQVAANHAVLWHPGLFASRRLECLLRDLGEAALPAPRPELAGNRRAGPLKVLHVASQVGLIGGHSRMLWRWIAQDEGNVHSVALTRQVEQVPASLAGAVTRSGGSLHRVNRRPGGLLAWARSLQTHLLSADLVVLHVHNMDVIPFLALGGIKRAPPTILLNHGDHLFWVGAGLVDAIVNSRMSGHALSATRRGIAPERNLLLPLCLEAAPERRLLRHEAKRLLGLPEDATVIVSVARAVKFRTITGASFADAFVPVLQDAPGCHLVAVGAGGAVDWSVAQAAVPGRIHAIAERPDTATYLEAADIYVDSFPFTSITSLFEAGLRGSPLVTRRAFGPDAAVAGADSVGLDGILLCAEDLAEFQSLLRDLLADPVLRNALGQRGRAQIERINVGQGWIDALTSVYRQVLYLPPLPRDARDPADADLPPTYDDVDVFSPFIFGTTGTGLTASERLALSTEFVLKIGPLRWRLRRLAAMARGRQLQDSSAAGLARYLVPEWLTCRMRPLRLRSS